MTKHILAVVVPSLLVSLEVHEEGTHEGVVVLGYLPRLAVDVRKKTVTEFHSIQQSVIYRLTLLAEIVEFTIDVSTMTAHHRGEGTKLHPTYKELLILRIASSRVVTLRTVRACKETTNVGIRVRIGSQGVVEAKRHLLAETVPRRTDITTPGVGTIALLTCKI